MLDGIAKSANRVDDILNGNQKKLQNWMNKINGKKKIVIDDPPLQYEEQQIESFMLKNWQYIK